MIDKTGVFANYFAKVIKGGPFKFIPDKSMWFNLLDFCKKSIRSKMNWFEYLYSRGDPSLKLRQL